MSEGSRPHRGGAGAVPGRAVLAGDQGGRLRLRLGPARARAGRRRSWSPGGIAEQTEQVFANLRAILEAAGASLDQLVKTTVFLQNLDDFAGDERGLRAARRRARRPRASTVEVAKLPSGALVEIEAIAPVVALKRDDRGLRPRRSGSTPIWSAAPCATSCSASTRRTPTSSSPASTSTGCARRSSRTAASRTSSSPGAASGVRLYPRDRRSRALAPAGIEFAPPRRERSTGPGPARLRDRRRPGGVGRGRPRAPRLHGQRDRAPARRRRARRPVRRPATTSSRACCARSRRRASRRTRCGSCAACASSRSSASSPTRRRSRRCASEAAARAARLGRAHRRRARRRRHGRAVEAAARAASRRQALRLARDTGVLVAAAAGVRAGDRLRPGEPLPRPDGRRAHVRRRAGGGRRRHARCAVRLAALFHDLGKPHVGWRGTRRPAALLRAARVLATSARAGRAPSSPHSALPRLRYPNDLRAARRPASSAHTCSTSGRGDPVRARRLLARYGEGLALELLDHKEADLRGKGETRRAPAGARAARTLPAGGRGASCASPHRLRDLAVDGNDLIALGYQPGPGARQHARDAARRRRRRPGAEHAASTLLERAQELLNRDPLGRAGRTSSRSRRASAASARRRTTRSTSPSAPATTVRASRRTGASPARRSGSTCAALALNRQVHSRDRAPRARRPARRAEGDGLWTDEPGVPLLAMSADCLPIVVADDTAARGARRSARGLARALRRRRSQPASQRSATARKRPAIGPAIGPCCYQVGPEVAERFDADLTTNGMLDLWTAAERRFGAAGVDARRPRRSSARATIRTSSSRTAATASRGASRV